MSTTNNLPVLSCDGCGAACCQHMTLPPFIPVDDDQEWREFQAAHPALHAELLSECARLRQVPIIEVWWQLNLGLIPESPCFWLDQASGRCQHHAERPEVCRDFEVGGEDCLAAREK